MTTAREQAEAQGPDISRSRTHCDRHECEAPWPAAVVRQCVNCWRPLAAMLR
jgi:hypothetical protein